MTRRIMLSFVVLLLLCCGAPSRASAVSLRIAPLDYQTTLSAGEKKKGYVDVVNTDRSTATIQLDVQGFRQTDNQGNLAFFHDDRLAEGIILDLTEVELLPGETVRVFFLIDGTKLPQGDTFAAIMARTAATASQGVGQSIQVGTLVIVQNGTPPARHAAVTKLEAPFLQIGDSLMANWLLTNTDPDTKTTGFFPQMTVLSRPYAQKDIAGPLVMAGRSREVSYRDPGNFVGLIWFTVQTGDSKQITPIFAVTGFWRWLLPFMLVVLGALSFTWYRQRSRAKKP